MFSSRYFTSRHWDAWYFAQAGSDAVAYIRRISLTGGGYDVTETNSGEYGVVTTLMGGIYDVTETNSGEYGTAVTLTGGTYDTNEDI